jgi:hypothetical protein
MVPSYDEAEVDLNNPELSDTDRAARRFARMCRGYGEGRVNFHASDYPNGAVDAGIALLEKTGLTATIVGVKAGVRKRNSFDACALVATYTFREPNSFNARALVANDQD